MAAAILETHYTEAYGIFAGAATEPQYCILLPSVLAGWLMSSGIKNSRPVLDDGRYELCIPYSDPRELMMDILKYGADVEVVAPLDLRQAVKQGLQAAVR